MQFDSLGCCKVLFGSKSYSVDPIFVRFSVEFRTLESLESLKSSASNIRFYSTQNFTAVIGHLQSAESNRFFSTTIVMFQTSQNLTM